MSDQDVFALGHAIGRIVKRMEKAEEERDDLAALNKEMAEAILSAERTWDASMIEPIARKLKAIKEQT